jgi:alkanesulfonate monooxygenase SsuD/methylene tetrahydromethanopterin reductase-like flavin-dependent oxidoreductase (luciferase family)
MEIGVVLPNNPGITRERVLAWARGIEQGPFSSLAVPDRLDYPNVDQLMTLAAAAAVTERVRLVTQILLSPLRPTPWLVKQVGTLTTLAPGRVVLGVGVGARPADYAAAGVAWERRGRILDEQLDALARARQPADPAQDLGPPPEKVPILMGGASPGALRRLARHGDGYISGGVRPEIYGHEVAATRAAWRQAGREGEPRIVAGTWFASDARHAEAHANREAYFVKGGPPPPVRDEIRRGRDGVRRAIEEFGAIGADELILFPMSTDPAELDVLADAVADLAAPAPVA